MPIFGLEYFQKWLSGNTFLKIGYQVNTKGNTKKNLENLSFLTMSKTDFDKSEYPELLQLLHDELTESNNKLDNS